MNNLSENLKRIRKDNGLSQEQLAEKLNVSRQSVSKWESSLAYPEMDKIVQLARMYDLNIDDLLNGDVSEAKGCKESKRKVDSYISSFLDYITKAVNLFSKLKLKTKCKCILEQILIILFLGVIFLSLGIFVGDLAYHVFPNLSDFLIRFFISLYTGISFVLSIIIVLHVFKIRYLDYYDNTFKDNSDVNYLDDGDKKVEGVNEKIIIRDPKRNYLKIIDGLFDILLVFIKCMLLFISGGLCLFLIFLLVLFICLFAIIRSGLVFVALLISLLASIVVVVDILLALYNFVFGRKINKKLLIYTFVSSVVAIGVGIGMFILGLFFFDTVDLNDVSYCEKEIILKSDRLDYVDYDNVVFVSNDSDDIRIVLRSSKYYDYHFYVDIYKRLRLYGDVDGDNLFEFVHTLVDDINERRLVDYSDYQIIIYTSQDNIDRLR